MSTTNPSKDDPNGDVTVGTSPPPAPPSTDTHIIIDVNGSLTGPTDPSAATASKDATSKSTPNGAPDAAEQQKEKPKEPVGKTWSLQHKLPKLPIPKLEDSCKRYLRALEGLQDPEEHENTKRVVQEFLTSGEGHKWQAKLEEYDKKVDSYIEEFWYESYLSHQNSVVLNLNPFFVLSTDVTPMRDAQLPRAASLILGSLFFIHDLRTAVLEPDTVRGTPLDMSQYKRLFGTSRVPTNKGCEMVVNEESRHVVVLRRGQFYWFDCLDSQNRPCLTDRQIQKNLEAIVADADKTPWTEVAQNAVGLLTTENRKIWSSLRQNLIQSNRNNAQCLSVVDSALFMVCLDDQAPQDLATLCGNFLCGSYEMVNGVQVGTCTNRWYDKLQIIVCANGEAGINFEHTGVDGHTVLRYAADVYTELVLLFAKSINPSTPSIFKAKQSPLTKGYKLKPGEEMPPEEDLETSPKKLTWTLTPDLKAGVRFAETRISDLICQNDSQALEFKGYGKNFITRHGFSPDAFVQMAFQAAFYGLYGRVESTYEPAMTKSFLHGRTESIRTVQPESVHFVKTFCKEGPSAEEKIKTLRAACKRHTALTKECSMGQGQDRHFYAMYSLIQREINASMAAYNAANKGDANANLNVDGNLDAKSTTSGHSEEATPIDGAMQVKAPASKKIKLPAIFRDPGFNLLGTSVLSTSNCGNPALRLFGFGPVTPEGHGIGYIIKDEGISVCASSKHLQTRRLLDTLQSYLYEVQRMLIGQWKQANERPNAFVDHSGVLRDSRTGKPIEDVVSDEGSEHEQDDVLFGGFGFYDAGVDVTNAQRKRKIAVGKTLQTSDW